MNFKLVKSIGGKDWLLIVMFLLISSLLFFIFQNAPDNNIQHDDNFRYFERWCALAFLLLGFLTIILNRQYHAAIIIIKVIVVSILLSTVIIVYGHSIEISHVFSTAISEAHFYENISPFLIPISAWAYALPYLIIVPLYIAEAKFKSSFLKYTILIPILFAVLLISLLLNTLVFFGLINDWSSQVMY